MHNFITLDAFYMRVMIIIKYLLHLTQLCCEIVTNNLKLAHFLMQKGYVINTVIRIWQLYSAFFC